MDRDGGYGWVSIALHWLGAAAILALLFAGDSIAIAGTQARDIHTTIGLCVWLLLAARIAWRVYQGHPPHAPEQGWLSFHAGLWVHYVLLVAIGLMLVSGPLAAWASGAGMHVFAYHLPGAATLQPDIYALARTLHVWGAVALGIGTALHVAGMLKHMFLDRDQTLDRIMVPPKPRAEKPD
jgi:cytochrome b561